MTPPAAEPSAPAAVRRRPALGIVGPYPPPYGGVSVGIQRLARYLEARGVDLLVYNEAGPSFPERRVVGAGGPRRLLWRLFTAGPRRILHYQSPDWRMRCLVALWGLLTGRRSVISIQGESLAPTVRAAGPRRALVRFFLRRTSAVITANPEIEAQVRALVGPRARVRTIPAFLPPPLDAPDPPLPADLERFLGQRSPRLLWVGWALLREGRDLYGLDLTLDLVERLRGRFPGLGCVLCFSGIRDAQHWERLLEGAERRGLRDALFTVGGLPEIHPLFRRVDACLRPTLSDGDSVAVREALALGTPVVASDAAPRPPACFTFRSGDAADFARATAQALEDLPAARARTKEATMEDNGAKILALYRELGL
ncbi:MAG TPA: glycosyltransferase family 4 protein [Candidatus Saccharimonadales bacterium]|nr:glycosyltransferase family 4 protein [Candidatus Saccharimonadales bacterium]